MIPLLLLLLSSAVTATPCFPGLYPCLYSKAECCCQHDIFGHGRVMCSNGSLTISSEYCRWVITCYHHDNVTFGFAPYHMNNSGLVDLSISCNLTCAVVNRTDTLCSRCINHHAVSVNTYDLRCVHLEECNLFLTLLAVFGPLTIFYLIVFLFRINAAAPYISLVISLAQAASTRQVADYILSQSISTSDIANKFLISLCSIWSLDVLQVYMPPMCLTEHFGNMEVLAFQYLIALYPLILVLVTYTLAELHARQWWCVYWLLWPIVKLFKVLHISIDPMRSIMNTFATFVLLSLTKFTIVSASILAQVELYDINGTVVSLAPLYRGDVKYFGSEHLPYAVFAILMLLLCNVLPLFLLFLSPLSFFQRCLVRCCCSFRCLHLVNTFLEVFQGHFKDRVCNHRDYRFVAGLQFLLRSVVFVMFSTVTTGNFALVISITLVMCLLWSVGGLIVRPYKNEFHNILEAILSCCYAIGCVLILHNYFLQLKGYAHRSTISVILLLAPLVMFGVHIISQILVRSGCHTKILSQLHMLYESTCEYLSWNNATSNNVGSNTPNPMMNYGSAMQ